MQSGRAAFKLCLSIPETSASFFFSCPAQLVSESDRCSLTVCSFWYPKLPTGKVPLAPCRFLPRSRGLMLNGVNQAHRGCQCYQQPTFRQQPSPLTTAFSSWKLRRLPSVKQSHRYRDVRHIMHGEGGGHNAGTGKQAVLMVRLWYCQVLRCLLHSKVLAVADAGLLPTPLQLSIGRGLNVGPPLHMACHCRRAAGSKAVHCGPVTTLCSLWTG